MTKKYIFGVLLAGLFVAYFFFDVGDYFRLDNLQAQKDVLRVFVAQHEFFSIVGYFILYFFAVALSLPIATALSLLAGFLFGNVLGTFIVVLSATCGAYVIYLVAKMLFHDWFYLKYADKIKKIQGVLKEEDIFYQLLFLRLVPLFPFFVVNIAPAFTNISDRKYIGATLFGIIPGAFVYVNAGKQLGTIEDPGDILSVQVLGAFVLLGALSLVPVAYRKWSRKKNIPTHEEV